MSKKAQKLISLLLALSLLMGLSISASAEVDGRVRTRVEGVGLMEGYEDGSFGEEDELTRAQMCMIAARMLQLETVGFGASPFRDVAEDHWAKDVIATLSQAGVVNGMGDGTFLPDKSVSYFEAAKILVSVLGYGDFAENMGGYPNGYLAQASKLGLLKGIIASNSAISRGEVAQMLYGALDAKPIGYNFMQNYPEAVYTLQEILSDSKDLVQFRGILTETAHSSLAATKPTLKEGVVLVAGQKLLCDMPVEDFLGCELIVYAYLDETVDKYRIKSFTLTNDNVIYEADAENVEWNNDEAVLYDDEGEELEELTMAPSSLITLYNGRKADIPAGERDVIYGGYRFVDSNDDGKVDVLFIEEAQSFIIDKINEKTKTVYFKDRATLNGRNAVVLESDDDDKSITLLNAAGEAIALSDIAKDNAITIFSSLDQNYMTAIVSDKSISGKITAKNLDGIQIDGESYELAKKPDGTTYFDPGVNEEATYVLDCYDKVVGSIGAVKSSYQYAYIINAKHGSGLGSGLTLQTVSGQTPQKEVVVNGDDETISYYFQNDALATYDCAPSFYLNDVKVSANSVNPAQVKETLAAFRLNSDGQIRELYTSALPGSISGSYAFNADILSFGGENVLRGFATDESTMFICVPENASNTENFSVQVKITDESAGNKVYGTVFFPDLGYEDPDTEPVDILMVKAEMDASVTVPIPNDGDVCFVGEVLNTVDDEGDLVYSIEMLNGEDLVTVTTKSGSRAETVAKSLRKGDLIRYVKDGTGKVTNILKLVSAQGLGDNYSSNVFVGSGIESGIYGLAYHSVPAVYDYFSNQMVDRLQLTYDENGTIKSNVYRLFHEDMPTVYKYDRRGGWISPGSIDDIRTYTQVGADADGILAIIENNDIKAFVIITDY